MSRLAYAVGSFAALAFAGCYDVPQPACGFACDPMLADACPSGYTCFPDSRCHRSSPPFTGACGDDAGPPLDLTPPEVLATSPAADAVDVPTNVVITAQFSEAVDVPFEGFVVFRDGVTRIDPAGAPTTIDLGVNWSFTPAQPLTPNTSYEVTLSTGIDDTAGNRLRDPVVWTFTTGVDPAPLVESTTIDSPNNVDVSVRPAITVTFSEPVFNVVTSTLAITRNGAVFVPETITPFNDEVYRVRPDEQLLPNTTYSLGFASAISDFSGNPLVATERLFTTGADTLPPGIRSSSPGSGGFLPVDGDVVVVFDEDATGIDDTTFTLRTGGNPPLPAVVSYNAGLRRATLSPLAQLDPGVSYTYTLGAGIGDLAGNVLGAPITVSFTALQDQTPPHILATQPLDQATNVPVDAEISVTFDEDVIGVTASSFSVVAAGAPSTLPGTVASADAGRTWIFVPDAPLPAGTLITVTLQATAITDPSTNPLATALTYSFTTAP